MQSSNTLHYDSSTTTGEEISTEHFGLNYVYDFEKFGDRPWEKFDEVVSSTGVKVIRYPGGAEAERVFDIRNPNAITVTLPDGSTRNVTPLNSFLDYVSNNNLQSVIIIPTQMALTDYYVNGHREFDAAWEQDIRKFVIDALEASLPNGIQTFELGNEYPAYMTPVEYGRIASNLTQIVDAAIDEFWTDMQIDSVIAQPKIAVQIWFESPGGGKSIEDLINHNATVMNEFDADVITLVDTVIGHYYYKEGHHLGEANQHSYSNIEASIQIAVDLMTVWTNDGANDVEYMISEWNVSFKGPENTGLSQIPVLLEMFTAFISNGIDHLDFWSAQYHSTSLAASNGELFAAGELFALMTRDLIGTKIADVSIESDTLDVHAFGDGSNLFVFVSSISGSEQSVDMSISEILSDYQLVSSTTIGVDVQSADGSYKDLTNLPIYLEPDVSFKLEPTSINGLVEDNNIRIDLKGFETNLLVFNIVAPNINLVEGTNSDDILIGTIADDRILGSIGNDTLYGGAGNDILLGGIGQDRFVISNETETAQILGFDSEFDVIDLQFLLEYQNNIVIGIGEESFLVSKDLQGEVSAAYNVDITSTERDTMIFIRNSVGETVITIELSGLLADTDPTLLVSRIYWGENISILPVETTIETLHSPWSEITTTSILKFEIAQEETMKTLHLPDLYGSNSVFLEPYREYQMFDGTDSNEKIFGNVGTDRVFAGGGQDFIDGGPGNDYLIGGKGNDAVFGGSGYDSINGGAGDDIMFGGEGTDLLMAGDGDDILVGGKGFDMMEGGQGSDTFVFFSHEGSNSDMISDFNPFEDTILVYGTEYSSINTSTVQDSIVISWQDNSISLAGVGLSDLTEGSFIFA